MLPLHRSTLIVSCLALVACVFLYATLGIAKPLHMWKWTDIVSEGGTAVMAGSWVLFTLSSRPGGLVTRLLAGGLAMIMVGSFADCMDEFFAISKAARWDHWLEMLVPLGMLVLTCGMYFWRHEQFRLNEHLQKRERLFRDHRAFDRITQLANADYLRRQIRLEQSQRPGRPCALVLLDIDSFHLINREFGQREGDRVLQAVGHMLLLNLRNDDLLCRYAGDRFALLLPDTSVADAEAMARHLAAMVGQMRHHAKEGRVAISVRHASASAHADADVLLAELGRALAAAAQVAPIASSAPHEPSAQPARSAQLARSAPGAQPAEAAQPEQSAHAASPAVAAQPEQSAHAAPPAVAAQPEQSAHAALPAVAAQSEQSAHAAPPAVAAQPEQSAHAASAAVAAQPEQSAHAALPAVAAQPEQSAHAASPAVAAQPAPAAQSAPLLPRPAPSVYVAGASA